MKISIRQYSFTISEPYSAGTVLNEAEARALNRLRAENIRNNMAKVVNREQAILADGALLPAEVLAGLQEQIAQYDSKYQFKPQYIDGVATFEAEVQEVALERQRVAGNLDQEVPPLEVLLQDEGVIEEARRRFEAKQASMTLESLL